MAISRFQFATQLAKNSPTNAIFLAHQHSVRPLLYYILAIRHLRRAGSLGIFDFNANGRYTTMGACGNETGLQRESARAWPYAGTVGKHYLSGEFQEPARVMFGGYSD